MRAVSVVADLPVPSVPGATRLMSHTRIAYSPRRRRCRRRPPTDEEEEQETISPPFPTRSASLAKI
jgi:hypothetical protein